MKKLSIDLKHRSKNDQPIMFIDFNLMCIWLHTIQI